MNLAIIEQGKLFEVRGQKVMLDRDVAMALGVETRELNQNSERSIKWDSVRNNDAYRFQLTKEELTSQFVMFHDFKHLPWVYTQLGCAHFGTSLNSIEACTIAIQLSTLYVKVMNGTFEEKYNSISDHELALKFASIYMKASELFETPKSLAKAITVQQVKQHYPNVSFNLLISENVSDTQDKLCTATELGEPLGISARKVNKALESEALIQKIGDDWELTDGAKQIECGVYIDTGKKHSTGTPVQQIKWYREKVTPYIKKAYSL